jgi:cell fate regulator YaaT (PSP1 superfamily)
MYSFITIKVRNKIYNTNTKNVKFNLNDCVIVQTEHGIELGTIYKNILIKKNKDIAYKNKSSIRILRKATQHDKQLYINNKNKTLRISNTVKLIIKEYNLCMKLIYMYYVLNCSKLFLYYVSNNRIDFRFFVKDLGIILKTKIQMVQIGVRDETKLVGGLGVCGQVLCCKKFLYRFNTITINMIKDQNMFLNINRLSGFCNRLKCCISYEQCKNIL